jgi:hypothetical protein
LPDSNIHIETAEDHAPGLFAAESTIRAALAEHGFTVTAETADSIGTVLEADYFGDRVRIAIAYEPGEEEGCLPPPP